MIRDPAYLNECHRHIVIIISIIIITSCTISHAEEAKQSESPIENHLSSSNFLNLYINNKPEIRLLIKFVTYMSLSVIAYLTTFFSIVTVTFFTKKFIGNTPPWLEKLIERIFCISKLFAFLIFILIGLVIFLLDVVRLVRSTV